MDRLYCSDDGGRYNILGKSSFFFEFQFFLAFVAGLPFWMILFESLIDTMCNNKCEYDAGGQFQFQNSNFKFNSVYSDVFMGTFLYYQHDLVPWKYNDNEKLSAIFWIGVHCLYAIIVPTYAFYQVWWIFEKCFQNSGTNKLIENNHKFILFYSSLV